MTSGSRAQRRFLCAMAICAFAGHGPVVYATEPTIPSVHEEPARAGDDGLEAARRAFHEGVSFANSGLWNAAIDAFTRSGRLRPHPVTSYNLASCHRALGHLTQARQGFRRALAEHASARLGLLPERLIPLASRSISEIERRLARITIVAEAPASILHVDGRPLERSMGEERAVPLIAGTRGPGAAEPIPSGKFDVWVDPGLHFFSLTSPRGGEVLIVRDLAPASHETVVFKAPETAAPRPVAKAQTRRQDGSGTKKSWAVAAFGVGAAGLAVGSISAYQALRKQSLLEDACGSRGQECPENRQGDIATMDRAADVSTIGFAVAAAGAALGFLLLAAFPEPDQGKSITARPYGSGKALAAW